MKSVVIFIVWFVFMLSIPALCLGDDSQGGRGHLMHFAQYPDATGWGVNSTYPLILADNWQASKSAWIRHIRFWGCWEDGNVGQIDSFKLAIYAGLRGGSGDGEFGDPGSLIWERDIPVSEVVTSQIGCSWCQRWFDPSTGYADDQNYEDYYRYDISLDSEVWFMEEEGNIYWLGVSAFVSDPINTQWGRKSSRDHWNAGASWAIYGVPDWIEMHEPTYDYIPGDVNYDGYWNYADCVWLIDYVYGTGPPPPFSICGIYVSAECSGNCHISTADCTHCIDVNFPILYCDIFLPNGVMQWLDLSFIISYCGDANGDGEINVSDPVSIVNYVFAGGDPPDPMEAGDVNCDGTCNVSDAVWLINYVFAGGNEPCDVTGDGVPDC